MGSAALKPSAAVGRLLRQKRTEFRLTLREVSERLAKHGDGVPVSTLARIEQGKLDPGVRRLHILLDFYQVPPHLVADLIELENLAVDPPPEVDLEALYQKGLDFWKKGDIAQGLAYLFAVRERAPDTPEARVLRQKATLSFAVAARNLGKFRLARQIVDDLLCEPPDPSLASRTLVLASSLWRGGGSMDVALALVRQASSHVRDEKDHAWVLHQEAKLLVEAGRLEEAERTLDQALALYRGLGDTYGEARAEILRGGLLEKRGDLNGAVECARGALVLSERHGHQRVAVVARLELGRRLAASGAVEPGLESLRAGLSQAILLNDRNAEFMAHYHLWKAHEQLGDGDRATFELKAAMHFVQYVDDHSPEADEVRALLREGSKR